MHTPLGWRMEIPEAKQCYKCNKLILAGKPSIKHSRNGGHLKFFHIKCWKGDVR